MAVKVIHVLRDGTVLDDITGHVVRYEDAKPIYDMMADINSRAKAAAEMRGGAGHEKAGCNVGGGLYADSI